MKIPESVHKATAHFYNFEIRGRGWHIFNEPILPELEFFPFEHLGYNHFNQTDSIDLGKEETFITNLVSKAKGIFNKAEEYEQPDEDYFPINGFPVGDRELEAVTIALPKNTDFSTFEAEQFLILLSYSRYPIAFEIIGSETNITFHFIASSIDMPFLLSNLKAYFPNGVFQHQSKYQFSFPEKPVINNIHIVDLGLKEEFMRPIQTFQHFQPDPLSSFIGVLDQLGLDDAVVLQIMFQGCHNPWSLSIKNAVTDLNGQPFFIDSPEMIPLAEEKTQKPLFAVTMSLLTGSSTKQHAVTLSHNLLKSLNSYSRINSNSLMEIERQEDIQTRYYDMAERYSRRSGMILNATELAGLVHLPSPSLHSSKIDRFLNKSRRAPEFVSHGELYLGSNSHLGQQTEVYLDKESRLRHTHIIGATGTGKSTLIANLILQDIRNKTGCCLLDPHGDLVDDIVKRLTKEDAENVYILDPSDTEFPIGLNLLEAHSEVEKIVLSSDLVTTFKRQSTSWGDQMTSVLNNAINAFLERPEGGTILDLRKFLIDQRFRNKILKTVEDPAIIYYWQNEFSLLRKNSISPILTRLDTFLRPKILRYMMAIKKGIDLYSIMKSKKVLLIKLSQGLIGKENSYLLGSLIVSKLSQVAQRRQLISKENRSPFYLMDEFQNFLTPSIIEILSGARKYGLGLVLAHQEMEQLVSHGNELTNSVLSNTNTRICFRVGDNDAKRLERGYNNFEGSDLQNLDVGEAIVKLGKGDSDFNLVTKNLEESFKDSEQVTNIIKTKTREDFSLSKDLIEKELEKHFNINIPKAESVKKEEKIDIEPYPLKDTTKIESKTSTEVLPKVETSDIKEKSKVYLKKEKEKKQVKEHFALQTTVKKLAEERGFKAVLEEPTQDGGRIDVGLTKDELRIAIEISVTNTVNYEVKNLRKCIRAKYTQILMTSSTKEHLASIRQLANQTFKPKELEKISFISPHEIVSRIDLIDANSKKPKEERIRGFRVRLQYSEDTTTKGQHEIIRKTILESLNRKGK